MISRSAEFSLLDYDNTARFIQANSVYRPRIAIVLGSGLGSLAENVENADAIPYTDLPHWPLSTVVGHSGRLIIGNLEERAVLVMQGRAHFYEGYSMAAVAYPIRVMKRLGTEVLIVTNAAGGVDPTLHPGDLMLIQDHLNLPGMAGNHPLRGPNDDAFGPRFPEMTSAYDRQLRRLAHAVAQETGIPLRDGVYAFVAGPSFETPAEIRLLRAVGASAVGMSTAPEVIVANHAGMRVLGISGISNTAVDDPDAGAAPDHEEVLAAGKTLVPKLATLIRGVLRRLDEAM